MNAPWKPLRRAILAVALVAFTACEGGDALTDGGTADGPRFVEANGVRLVAARSEAGLRPADGGILVRRVFALLGAVLRADDARLVISPGSMSQSNATITIEPMTDGTVGFRFGPSGLGFSPAARLTIDAGNADVPASEKHRLRIAGASDTADDWVVIGGTYDPLTDSVTAPVSHFSRYALCID